MKPVLTLTLLLALLSLQGCVAAVIPLAAAGAIGKKEIDKDKKNQPVSDEMTAKVTIAESEPALSAALPVKVASTPVALASLNTPNPYEAFVDYALGRQQARNSGEEIRSSVLVENPSLNDPRTIDCAEKPIAVIIDVDQEAASSESIAGLSILLQRLRASDIRIAWIGNGAMELIEGKLDAAALLDRTDIVLPAAAQGPTKQEQRTGFAVGHCVVALAGDRQTDFDELFDYLVDPGYAGSLDKFRGSGWFLLPSPLTPVRAAL